MNLTIPKARFDSSNKLHGSQTVIVGSGEDSAEHKLVPAFPWAANSSLYAVSGRFVHGELQGTVVLYYSLARGGYVQVNDGYMHGGIITYGQIPVLPVSFYWLTSSVSCSIMFLLSFPDQVFSASEGTVQFQRNILHGSLQKWKALWKILAWYDGGWFSSW